jgi:hypothetical protein
MSSTKPTEPLVWNAGGWFGSQLGGTTWLLVGSISMLHGALAVGLFWLFAFGLANGLGLVRGVDASGCRFTTLSSFFYSSWGY